ncbi:MAG: PLP-dependent aminotransferase family protein [Oricola sp.]
MSLNLNIVTMTSWLPDLNHGEGPLYMRLAGHIEDAIETGALPAGSKLPPQRNLAFDLGVTVGTVSRAYSIVRERGLVSGEVGRGTYVLKRQSDDIRHSASRLLPAMPGSDKPAQPEAAIPMTSTAAADVGQGPLVSATIDAASADTGYAGIDYIRSVPPSWQQAGSAWLSHGGWSPDPALVVPVLGVHAGIMAAVAAVSAIGDRIAFEELCYPATPRAVAMTGRRIARLRSTPDGIDPENFEHVCAQQHPKAVVLVATLNNPTLGTVPEANRRRIVEIARQYNVWIIEDNIYGGLKDETPPPIASFAPERTFQFDGLSKSVSAGLRSGWVSCPPGYVTRVANAHRLLTGGAPFLLMETAARLVLSGEAGKIRNSVRQVIAKRAGVAAETLSSAHPNAKVRSDPDCPFVWLTLPEPWLPGTFCKAAQEAGVTVEGADEYKLGSLDYPCPNVRVSLTGPLTDSKFKRALSILSDLLSSPSLNLDSLE